MLSIVRKRTYVRDRVGRFGTVSGGPGGATGQEVREGAMWRDPATAERAKVIQRDAPTTLERDNAIWIADAEERSVRVMQQGDTWSKNTHPDGTPTAERAKLHGKILDEWSQANDDKPVGLDQPTIVFMGGLPGAGKTTAAKDLELSDKVVINADAFKTGHDEATGKRWSKLPEYQGGHSATLVHEESSYLANEALDLARRKRQHIVFDATMGSLGKGATYEEASSNGGLAGKIKQFKDAGYRVEARFVDVDPEVSVERALTRYLSREKASGTGRYVPRSYIRSLKDPVHRSKNRQTFEAVKHTLDAYRIVENSGKSPITLGEFGTLTKREEPRPGAAAKTIEQVWENADAPYTDTQLRASEAAADASMVRQYGPNWKKKFNSKVAS